MRGRKPTLVADNQASDKLDDQVEAPAWFSPEARGEWDRIMPSLVKRRILTTADLGSVENYCVAVGRVREIEKMLQEPYRFDLRLVRAQDKAIATARQLAAEIGVTPMSRARPAIAAEEDDDDFAGLDL